ncbi:uncharacterized protein LOC143690008 [Tamandua tetradactyla]|uniref:uncharacterized protein LOC143690008 n=1 Tax=Tamandua tetradactyla TaxID=48850 RepID=UPI0040539EC6
MIAIFSKTPTKGFANSSVLILKAIALDFGNYPDTPIKWREREMAACSLERLTSGTAFPQPPWEHHLSDCIALRSSEGDNVLLTVTVNWFRYPEPIPQKMRLCMIVIPSKTPTKLLRTPPS